MNPNWRDELSNKFDKPPTTVSEGLGEVNKENLNQEMNQHEIVLVFFSSEGCRACIAMKARLPKLIEEMEGRVHCIGIDVDNQSEIARLANVDTVPTIQLFHNEELEEVWVGPVNRSEIKSCIEKL
tara:strand:- start:1400 stop:1777 length:378 start_codon:yes stop_codon:yes gene_type:complete